MGAPGQVVLSLQSAASLPTMFAQAKANLIKLIGTQRTALNLGIRYFANYLLFAIYPKYLLLYDEMLRNSLIQHLNIIIERTSKHGAAVATLESIL